MGIQLVQKMYSLIKIVPFFLETRLNLKADWEKCPSSKACINLWTKAKSQKIVTQVYSALYNTPCNLSSIFYRCRVVVFREFFIFISLRYKTTLLFDFTRSLSVCTAMRFRWLSNNNVFASFLLLFGFIIHMRSLEFCEMRADHKRVKFLFLTLTMHSLELVRSNGDTKRNTGVIGLLGLHCILPDSVQVAVYLNWTLKNDQKDICTNYPEYFFG